ncbi:hexose transporter [Coprinopsis cinerea okayama7|uniref:Hexose transporter n=1 Tax=Coprinopsis cinerea (strain Okayama-7 / 130 / ATCC MYA-4618 / FGSC 9003) TaxID=240176 RepID=A8P6T6_COPC7|nr:hexose transporter [Coprinopsis cinerea okayama7\|eukprot:XP_001839222.1 hexose transporter [Coprinopsis cinerea okayama7\
MASATEDRKSPVPAEEEPNAIVTRLVAQDPTPWYKKPNLRMLYIIFIPTCLGVEMTSGFDSSMMNGLQAVDSWDQYFNQPRSALLGLMSAIYSLGAIAAVPFVPWVTDKWGRRFAIFFGSVIMVIGAVIQTASQNFAMFVISRFIMGIGIVFAIVAASSLIGELSYPRERAIMGSLFNACWFIGAIAAAGTTLGTFSMSSTWGWRIPSVLQAFPSLLQIIFVYFLPESPRWLIAKGRGSEAFAILAKYHAEGDHESELVKAEYVQIETTLELEKETSKVGWTDLLKTAGMRRRLIIGAFLGLATQWSGNGLISYFLARILDNVGITDNRTKNIVNLANTCWGFFNATILALTVSRFPRRVMYLVCTISLLLVFTGWTVASARYALTEDQASSKAVIAFIFLYSPCYNIAFNALTYTFLVELFPFHVRAKGITIFQIFSRCAGFFNQFVNPIGIENVGWYFYLSYVGFLLFEVLFIFFMFPETHGKTLEELAFLFEKDEIKKQNELVEKTMQNEQVVEGKDEESKKM